MVARVFRTLAVAAAWTAGTAPDVHAQCRMDLVDAGIEAYRELRLDGAATHFNEAVAANGSSQCWTENARTLVYLGAAHWLAERPDSAARAFERAVVQAPRFRPDAVEFPPAVTDLFDRVRRRTPAVAATLAEEVEIGPRSAGRTLGIRLIASMDHLVSVRIRSPEAVVRTLYEGGLEDDPRGMLVEWDGRDHGGASVPSGWYDLEIVSRDAWSRPVRKLLIGLAVESDASEGLVIEPEIVELADSVARASARASEGGGIWPALGVAGAGLVGAAAVVALPRLLDDRGGSWTRYPVAGALGLAGVLGFVHHLSRGSGETLPAEARELPDVRLPPPPPTLRIRRGYERRTEVDPLGTETSEGPRGGAAPDRS